MRGSWAAKARPFKVSATAFAPRISPCKGGAPLALLASVTLRATSSAVSRISGSSKGIVIGFWIVTALFCLQCSFTVYAQLRLPQVAEAFTHLGFPAYFRVELAWAKLLGVMLLLAPVPARLKEWAYAGFAINLASALIAHLAVGDGPEAWGWAVGTGVLWAFSYLFWRLLQVTKASA